MARIDRIADFLRQNSLPVLSVHSSEFPDAEDDEIKLTERVALQVGANYFIAVKWNAAGDALKFYPTRGKVGAVLLSDLRKALEAGDE